MAFKTYSALRGELGSCLVGEDEELSSYLAEAVKNCKGSTKMSMVITFKGNCTLKGRFWMVGGCR